MRLTDVVITYNATDIHSLKHLWRRNGPNTAICGEALAPFGFYRFVDHDTVNESNVATCMSCLAVHAGTIAREAHAGQLDPDGEPHIEHVLRVARAVAPFGDEVVATALLHDVVEDSNVTSTRLREEHFPTHIIEAVYMLSRDRDEDRDTYMVRVGSETAGPSGKLARLVKRADIRDNLERSTAQGDAKRIERYTRMLGQVTRAMYTYRELDEDEMRELFATYDKPGA